MLMSFKTQTLHSMNLSNFYLASSKMFLLLVMKTNASTHGVVLKLETLNNLQLTLKVAKSSNLNKIIDPPKRLLILQTNLLKTTQIELIKTFGRETMKGLKLNLDKITMILKSLNKLLKKSNI